MQTLDQKRSARLKFLHSLYQQTDGNPHQMIEMSKVLNDIGLNFHDGEIVFEYLRNEGLAEVLGYGKEDVAIHISHQGVRQVEDALSHPSQPTEYFPPAQNVIHIENMYHSAIQQGTSNSTQVVELPDTSTLKQVLDQIASSYAQLGVTADTLTELQVEVQTVQTQLTSPKPKAGIIGECLGSIRKILESATGAVAAKLLSLLLGLNI